MKIFASSRLAITLIAMTLCSLLWAAPALAINPATGSTAGGESVVVPPAGVTFVSISHGIGHSVAIGSDGHAYAWGSNRDGQLGNGQISDR